MASSSSSSSSIAISPVLMAVIVMIAMAGPMVEGRARGRARAFFVFGDSLVDSGNNNYLASIARASAPPYGVDYPTHQPTGRFSNGFNIPDIISQELGAETTLPYLNPQLKGKKLLVGANFASAGIGILNDTGFQFATIIRMPQQLEFFRQYQQRLSAVIGEQQARVLVKKALVLVTNGGNDFVNNYYLSPITTLRRLQYNLSDFCQLLISQKKKYLQEIYRLGARRVLVTGMGPIGCAPVMRARLTINGECAEGPQRGSQIYDSLLVPMLKGLNREIGSDVFIAVNAGKVQNNFFDNPRAYGFLTSSVACCGQGRYNGRGFCTSISNLCRNRDLYAFWDAFHPTERANRILVSTIYNGSSEYMWPMNLSTIMELDSRV